VPDDDNAATARFRKCLVGQAALISRNRTRERSSLTACSSRVKRTFAHIATAVAHHSGRPITFLLAALIIIAWGVTGPIFGYSDTWQLIINTGTTIITCLLQDANLGANLRTSRRFTKLSGCWAQSSINVAI
jgi:hypothetical protein